jgi:hypothetical protein
MRCSQIHHVNVVAYRRTIRGLIIMTP